MRLRRLPDSVTVMAVAYVRVDKAHRAEVDTHMSAQGFATWLAADEGRRVYKLPPGIYWMAEPTDADDLRARCREACKTAGVVSAQIIVTSGPSSWDGLPLINGD